MVELSYEEKVQNALMGVGRKRRGEDGVAYRLHELDAIRGVLQPLYDRIKALVDVVPSTPDASKMEEALRLIIVNAEDDEEDDPNSSFDAGLGEAWEGAGEIARRGLGEEDED